MKTSIFILSFFITLFSLSQNPGEWVWMNGSSTDFQPIYGTQGVSSPTNTPGQLYEANSWVDQNGNLWLYGGSDPDNKVNNDLWKFNITTNEWTWMNGSGTPNNTGFSPNYGVQGIPSPTTNPGEANTGQSASWVDFNGDLWLLRCNLDFTANGFCSLWKYEISTNMWTWVQGNLPGNNGTLGIPSSLNNPSSFGESPVSWIDDAGDLWFFDGYNNGVMWKYNITSNMWARMNGPTPTSNSIYGTQGVPDSNNGPGQCQAYSHWEHENGCFYLYVNSIMQPTTRIMWKFDPSINQWAWMTGDLTNSEPSTFDSSCNFSNSNLPSYFGEDTPSWADDCGNLILYNSLESFLWMYNPENNQFLLLDGDLSPNFPVYGTQGSSSPLVDPGPCQGRPYWQDLNGDLWLLGAGGDFIYPSTVTSIPYTSAMWKYKIDPSCYNPLTDISIETNLTQGCAPLEIQFEASINSTDLTYNWDFGDPLSSNDNSNLYDPNYTYNTPGSYTATLYVNGNSSCGFVEDTIQLQINVTDEISVTVNDTTICFGETAELYAEGASNYIWSPSTNLNTTVGSTVIASPTATIDYVVTGNIGNCFATDIATVTILPTPSATIEINPTTVYESDPSVTLSATSNAQTFSWYFNDNLISNLQSFYYQFPEFSDNYSILLITQNEFSCIDSTHYQISVIDDIIFYVPNTFTPDNNSLNEIFMPIITSGIDLTSIEFEIFNRWGEQIFNTSVLNQGWNGTYLNQPSPDGVYNWVLKFKSIENAKKHEYHGHVVLIR